MNSHSFAVYLLVMAGTTYLVRLLPLLLVKRQIKNRFILSFLHYIPYTVLTAMTIPACFYATGHLLTAIIGFIVAFLLAFRDRGLLLVAAGACGSVLLAEILLGFLWV